MGLDSYLYLERYESKWRIPDEKKKEWEKTFFPPEMGELADLLKKRDLMTKTTSYQVAYWRKANAIHKWFVDECGEGIDECQKIWVPVEKLEQLVAICSEILLDHERAEELLPTESGFFFGGTEYDEWYFKDLEETVEMLDPICKFIRSHKDSVDWDIYYSASW